MHIIYVNKKICVFTDDCTRGFKRNGVCTRTGLIESIYTLNDNTTAYQLEYFTSDSVFILISLIKHTKLFGENLKIDSVESLLKNKEALFIGSLLVKLYKVCNTNNQQIIGENRECKYSNDNATCHINSCCIRGYLIAPLNSLMNHSCHANAKNIIIKTQRIMVFALEPIKKGSQV